MKRLSLVLYMALALCANTALADMAHLADMREGDMKKLVFHDEPAAAARARFRADDGSALTLSDYQGKFILLNFWATWCAPCRKEMPMLSELQAELGGDEFEVVTLATGRNPARVIKKFFADAGIDNLPLHRDPKHKVAREMGVFGLPITVILNPGGQEIARMQGDAHWSSDNAKAIISALIDGALGD